MPVLPTVRWKWIFHHECSASRAELKGIRRGLRVDYALSNTDHPLQITNQSL